MFGLLWPVVSAPDAVACSCGSPDAAQLLATVPAGFIGTPTETFEIDNQLGDPVMAVSFDVIEAIKGDIGDTAVLVVKSHEDTCGSPQFLPGWPYTRFGQSSSVIVSAGMRAGEACLDLSPGFLSQGVSELAPLMPPTPDTKAEFLSIGEWMGTGARLYGADGTAAAYIDSAPGFFGSSAAVCGDSNVVAHTSMVNGLETLLWRDIATTEVVAEHGLSGTASDPTDVWSCTTSQRVVVSEARTSGGWRVIGPDGFDVQPIPTARKLVISADGRVAAAELNQLDFSVIEIDSGQELGSFAPELLGPGPNWGLALSPDGTKLAVATNNARTLAVVTAAGELISSIAAPEMQGRIWWLDDETIAASRSGTTARVDLAASEPSLSTGASGEFVSSAGTRVLTHSTNSGRYVVTDLQTGERYEIDVASGTRHPLHLLAQPVVVQDNGFVPSTDVPLAGVRVPRTIDELVADQARGSGNDLTTGQRLPGQGLAPVGGEPNGLVLVVVAFVAAAAAGSLALVARQLIRQRTETELPQK